MLKGSESGEKSFSRPIVGIALAGIALGMTVMILSMAIVTGFKSEVRNKVTGFGAHIQITGLSMNNSFESEALLYDPQLPAKISPLKSVKHVQVYATKPGIVETPEDIQGVITKGIAADFDWSFFNDKLVAGSLPFISDTATSDHVLISKSLADLLRLNVEDRISIYFSNLSGTLSPRRFTISGLYETGLEEFDNQFVFIDIAHLQRINRWGIEAQVRLSENCAEGLIHLEPLAFGGDGKHRYKWSDIGLTDSHIRKVCIKSDSTIQLVVSDRSETLPDSVQITFHYPAGASGCLCDPAGVATVTTSGGSDDQYIGGYEVTLHNFKDLDQAEIDIYNELDYDLKTTTIAERIPEIFNWLEMIDINPKIIITLMIVVAVINMSSALLILILERVNMIGILKALGASDWSVRKIFLHNALFLISRGLLIGNLVGIGLCLLQDYFGIVKLDPINYYVSEVPVMIQWEHILILNIGTLSICLLVLIVPSYFITRISPVKAIRFD